MHNIKLFGKDDGMEKKNMYQVVACIQSQAEQSLAQNVDEITEKNWI